LLATRYFASVTAIGYVIAYFAAWLALMPAFRQFR